MKEKLYSYMDNQRYLKELIAEYKALDDYIRVSISAAKQTPCKTPGRVSDPTFKNYIRREEREKFLRQKIIELDKELFNTRIALNHLEPVSKAVMNLIYIEGLTGKQAAYKLGISTKKVSKLKKKSFRQLKQICKES